MICMAIPIEFYLERYEVQLRVVQSMLDFVYVRKCQSSLLTSELEERER